MHLKKQYVCQKVNNDIKHGIKFAVIYLHGLVSIQFCPRWTKQRKICLHFHPQDNVHFT